MNGIAKMMMLRNNTRDDSREDGMPEARRRRDSRGRYMEGDDGPEMRRYMEDGPEMRRRRDSRGRDMEDDTEMRRRYDGSYNDMDDRDAPESRFRDRRGRERYDDGRFAPMRGGGRIEWEDYPRDNGNSRAMYPRIPPYMPDMEDRPAGLIGFMGREDREANAVDYSPETRRANMYALPRRENGPMGFMGGEDRGPSMHGGKHRQQEQRMGQSSEARPFDHEMAKEWTRGLKNEDGSSGPHYTTEQAKSLMAQVRMEGEPMEFWAVLNSMYSDYCKVLKKFGLDRPEVYAELAKAWLDDKDAVEGKAAAYFECIVKH